MTMIRVAGTSTIMVILIIPRIGVQTNNFANS